MLLAYNGAGQLDATSRKFATSASATAYAAHSHALVSVPYNFIPTDLWLISVNLLHLLLKLFLHYCLLNLLWLDLGRELFQPPKEHQKGPRLRVNSGNFLVGLWRCPFSLMVHFLSLNSIRVFMNSYCGQLHRQLLRQVLDMCTLIWALPLQLWVAPSDP